MELDYTCKVNPKTIRQLIKFSVYETCSRCGWEIWECPIAAIAQYADPEFTFKVFCEFDLDKLVDFIFREIKRWGRVLS